MSIFKAISSKKLASKSVFLKRWYFSFEFHKSIVIRVVGVSANIAGHWRPDSEYHADFKSGNIFLVRLILGVHSASKVLGVFLHFC